MNAPIPTLPVVMTATDEVSTDPAMPETMPEPDPLPIDPDGGCVRRSSGICVLVASLLVDDHIVVVRASGSVTKVLVASRPAGPEKEIECCCKVLPCESRASTVVFTWVMVVPSASF